MYSCEGGKSFNDFNVGNFIHRFKSDMAVKGFSRERDIKEKVICKKMKEKRNVFKNSLLQLWK